MYPGKFGCGDPQDLKYERGANLERISDIYECARQEGKREVMVSWLRSKPRHPPALEDILKGYDTVGGTEDFYSGFIVPERIVGTYDSGRSVCFSPSFRPLPRQGCGDFASKWMRVYRDVNRWLDSGNKIELFEFMHDLYISEGNKRVSVARYLNMPEVNVRVKRIIPSLSNNLPEVDDYHEYLDFERRTGLKWIRFSPGKDYKKIEGAIDELYGENPKKYDRFMKEVFVPFLHSYMRASKHAPVDRIGDVFIDFLEDVQYPVEMKEDEREKVIRKKLKSRKKSRKTHTDVAGTT